MGSNYRKMALYSGFDAATQTYDKSTWNYEGGRGGASAARRETRARRPTAVNSDP